MALSIHVSISKQQLQLLDDDKILFECAISTGKEGAGEQNGSLKTPRGRHIVRAKIGNNAPINSVFVGRRPTGEIYSPELAAKYPNRDWILTRILWLSGCEPGKNRLGPVDTMRRYIYIHGTPPSRPVGTPYSHGCVTLHNEAMLKLFDLVPCYTPVVIEE